MKKIIAVILSLIIALTLSVQTLRSRSDGMISILL